MYESFYGLSPTPFRLTPDPLFFFEGVTHKRGLAFLRYAFLQQEGFVVITGAPGTGKTELMLNLINELPGDQVTLAKVVTSNLGADDLLDLVAASFLSLPKATSKGVTLTKLEEYFRYQARQGKQILLLIDEAHNLHVNSLIELSMLTNFQMGENPVLQCFLMGQEPLEKTLALPELAHLKQRVIVSTHLEPLSQHDTRAYIEHRLSKAGWKRDPEFTKAAHSLIFQYSEGIPRKINTVCNRILLEAYLDGKHIIDHRLAFKIIKEVHEETSVSPMNLDPDILVTVNTDSQAPKTKQNRQYDKYMPHTPSSAANSTLGNDRTSIKPGTESKPAMTARAISAVHTYSHDHDDAIVVAKLPSANKEPDFKPPIGKASATIPNNVLRLNTTRNKKRTVEVPSAAENIRPKTKPNNRDTSQRHTNPKQSAKVITDNTLHDTNTETRTRQSGLVDKELRSLAASYPNTAVQDAKTTTPQIDPQEAHYKKIIIDELAQDLGIRTAATVDEDKEYERLSSAFDSSINWSPISKLGIAISLISLFVFWWFIYGPGLDATLETIIAISNTIQDKLDQYNF